MHRLALNPDRHPYERGPQRAPLSFRPGRTQEDQEPRRPSVNRLGALARRRVCRHLGLGRPAKSCEESVSAAPAPVGDALLGKRTPARSPSGRSWRAVSSIPRRAWGSGTEPRPTSHTADTPRRAWRQAPARTRSAAGDSADGISSLQTDTQTTEGDSGPAAQPQRGGAKLSFRNEAKSPRGRGGGGVGWGPPLSSSAALPWGWSYTQGRLR